MIKVMAIGDLVGKAGRRSIQEILPLVREKHSPDIVIANGENAAGGFGITKKIFNNLTEKYSIDCVTTGNHWHDKREVYEFYQKTDRLVVPANMMNVDNVEDGYTILSSSSGVKFAVVNLIGKAFMHPDNKSPFTYIDKILERIPEHIKVRILDFHAEATSEKQAIAHYLSGKFSLVYGTHTHVPTGDERIIDDYTGFTTDIGMTGAYDSVIGIKKEASLNRMLHGVKKKFEPATKDLWLCFVIAHIDEVSGACKKIERHRLELDRLSI